MRQSLWLLVLLPALAWLSACKSGTAPSFTSAEITEAKAGEAYEYEVTVTGDPAPTLEATELPEWLTLEGAVLRGTPTDADVGTHQVTLTAANGVSPEAVQSFGVTVIPSGSPAFTSAAPTAATEGVQYAYQVVASGEPAPTITATQLPGWLTLEANVLSGTPAYADGGAHQVVLTARNGIEPDAVQSFTVTVATVSTAPGFSSTPVTTATEGLDYSYAVAVSGTPAPVLTATVLPGWLTFDGTTLSGTPAFENGGTHEVTLTAVNGIAPDASQTFTVTVTTVSTAPAFTSVPVTAVEEGTAYSYTVTTSGAPAAQVEAFGGGGAALPAWLSFDPLSGNLSGTPGASDVGVHDVYVTATNGIPPDAQQPFTITVSAIPVAPTITSTAVTEVTEGQPYDYAITATGLPVPVLTVTGSGGGALPSWLAFDGGTGVLSGTPAASDVGTVDILVTAANGALPDATQAFTITVSPANFDPAFTSTAPITATVGALYSYPVMASGNPTPVISVAGEPGWLAFDGATNTLSGTPGQGDLGVTGTITLTATGFGTPATQSFQITVDPMPAIAVAGNPYFQDFGTTTPLGWTANGLWQFGLPTTGAASVGPPSAVDGALAGTNLTGPYANDAFYSLRTPTFDLTGAADPVLRFVHWHNLELGSGGQHYDGANLKLSTDGGATFVQLVPSSVSPAYTGTMTSGTVGIASQPGWSGITSDWQIVTVDLAANLAGQPLDQVVLRFDLGSDDFVGRPGWYVDAVRVGALLDLPVAPAITSAPPGNPEVVAGTAFSYAVTASGQPAPTLAATGPAGAPLPAWLTFDPATGVLSGTPANGDAGAQPIVITAANGEPPPASLSFTLTVLPLEVLAAYDFEGNVYTPSTVFADVTASTLNNRDGTATFVGGNPSSGRAITSNGFSDPANPNYFQFTVTPVAGKQVTLEALALDYQRSATGPTSFELSVVVGGIATPVTSLNMPTVGSFVPVNITFSGPEAGPYTGAVTLRLTGIGASGSMGTLRLDNVALRGIAGPRANEAPSLLNAPPQTASIGVAYDHVIQADGWPAPTVTVTGRPAWLAYDAATRTLSGTPSALFTGTSGTITVTATNGISPAATQTFTITIDPPPAVAIVPGTPVEEGFGAALPAGWAANGDWQFGTPTTGGSSVGPPSLHDGEVAATKLTGNYSSSLTSTLQTPVFDLTGLSDPRLQFVHWHNFEASATTRYDGGNIKLSTDGGATWIALAPSSVTPAYSGALTSGSSLSNELAWSGILAGWELVVVDLAANLAGLPTDKVVLRFQAGSDSFENRPGWYLDDVRIGAAADLGVAPSITSQPPLSARVGAAYSYQVATTGVPAPALTATAAAGAPLPAWLGFDPATGLLSGTPAGGDEGTLDLVITATNAQGADTQSYTLTVFAAGAQPSFFDDFEGDPALTQWSIGFNAGTASDWGIGTPTVVGPAAAYSGIQCAGTVLNGNYTIEDRLSFLQTPVIDLTGHPSAALRFRHWLRTESTYDGGNVKISTDGGLTFAPLAPSSVSPAYSGSLSTSYGNPLGGQLAWWGLMNASWGVVNVNLEPDLAGLPRNQVVLRFEFGADDDVNYPGWYVDDVGVGDVVTLP